MPYGLFGRPDDWDELSQFVQDLTDSREDVEKYNRLPDHERERERLMAQRMTWAVDHLLDEIEDHLANTSETLKTFMELSDDARRDHKTGTCIRRLQWARSSLVILETKLDLQATELEESGKVTSTLTKQDIASTAEKLRWIEDNGVLMETCIDRAVREQRVSRRPRRR
jgi:hypothetical protein